MPGICQDPETEGGLEKLKKTRKWVLSSEVPEGTALLTP